MLSKLIYLAPIVFTTAGVTALVSIKIEDHRTKQILRVMALVMAVGAVATLIQQSFDLVEALAKTEHTLAEQRRMVEEERAKAAEASRLVTEAENAAKQAKILAEAEAKRLQIGIEQEARRAEQTRVLEDQARREAQQVHENKLAKQQIEEKKQRDDAERAAVAARDDDRRKRAAQQQNACDQCCNARAPSYYNGMTPADAISGCFADCIRGVPDNYGTFLCKF